MTEPPAYVEHPPVTGEPPTPLQARQGGEAEDPLRAFHDERPRGRDRARGPRDEGRGSRRAEGRGSRRGPRRAPRQGEHCEEDEWVEHTTWSHRPGAPIEDALVPTPGAGSYAVTRWRDTHRAWLQVSRRLTEDRRRARGLADSGQVPDQYLGARGVRTPRGPDTVAPEPDAALWFRQTTELEYTAYLSSDGDDSKSYVVSHVVSVATERAWTQANPQEIQVVPEGPGYPEWPLEAVPLCEPARIYGIEGSPEDFLLGRANNPRPDGLWLRSRNGREVSVPLYGPHGADRRGEIPQSGRRWASRLAAAGTSRWWLAVRNWFSTYQARLAQAITPGSPDFLQDRLPVVGDGDSGLGEEDTDEEEPFVREGPDARAPRGRQRPRSRTPRPRRPRPPVRGRGR